MGRLASFITSSMVDREDKKKTNKRTMFPALKNNAAAGYKGPVIIELLEGTCLLNNVSWTRFAHERVITRVQTVTSLDTL